MNILAVIPARGGSKGIPQKNIKLLHGKPLIAYSIIAALSSKHITRILLTTDSEQIAEAGRNYGLNVPFLRPAELAQDTTPMLPVLQHAVRWVEEHEAAVDVVCLLQPTSPLRTVKDIDQAIELFLEKSADTLISTLPVPLKYNPHWVYVAGESGGLRLFTGENAPISRRQDLPLAFHREGSIYLVKRQILMEQNSIYGEYIVGYPINPTKTVNLDSPEDWELAERLLASPDIE